VQGGGQAGDGEGRTVAGADRTRRMGIRQSTWGPNRGWGTGGGGGGNGNPKKGKTGPLGATNQSDVPYLQIAGASSGLAGGGKLAEIGAPRVPQTCRFAKGGPCV